MPLIPNGDQMRDCPSRFSHSLDVSEPFGSSNDTAVGWVERSLIDSGCYKY